MRRTFTLALLLFLTGQSFAQLGCTDPNALNHNPLAAENDGSCAYEPVYYRPTELVTLQNVVETSGLIYFNGKIFTHNDSGGEPEIYDIDTLTGANQQVVRLQGLTRDSISDWEDISQSADKIYIGDCGNNNGDRRNLCFYVVNKSDICNQDTCILPWQRIPFHYPEQTSFESNQSHNFDCEGFFFYKDSLHLFTKNRGNFYTYHYTVPAIPSAIEHPAHRVDSFLVMGQITGADIAPDGQQIALIGYYNLATPFMWYCWDYQPGHFFSGNKRRIELAGPEQNGQQEAIAYKSAHELYISNEGLADAIVPRIYQVDNRAWLNETMAVQTANSDLQAIVQREADVIRVHTTEAVYTQVFALNGQQVYQTGFGMQHNIATADWPKGIYLLKMYSGNKVVNQKILVD